MLANQDFHVGVNDVLGADPTLASFNASAMTLFSGWLPEHGNSGGGSARSSIARGEVFNTKPISITGVGGLNDALGLPVIAGTCTTCHDAPNVGNHSVALPINIGTADASLRTPDMPLYTLRNNATGALVQTTDPARALITGKWADIGKFKGPVLRDSRRAPYFHNGRRRRSTQRSISTIRAQHRLHGGKTRSGRVPQRAAVPLKAAPQPHGGRRGMPA
jgi:hypothetical protein